MSQASLTIAYLYPSEMNIYGDRGNIITLVQRCQWRGIQSIVKEVHLGQKFDFSKADIIFGGGGQDKGQELVAKDLQTRGNQLKVATDQGKPMLLVCGLYQLFGRQFTTVEGKQLEGIGLFNLETKGGQVRMIGNLVVESRFGRLVGFENHSGQTRLDTGQESLGRVIKGFGNDEASGYEGAIKHNAIGTYLHGPVLPKNPGLADFMIQTALTNKTGKAVRLEPLDDSLELRAAQYAMQLPR